MVFEKKQLSKVLAIALMVACAVAFMPLLSGQVFAASKVTGVKAKVSGTTATVTWKKVNKAKQYTVKVTGAAKKTVKAKKPKAVLKGLAAGNYKVKVKASKGAKTKWSKAVKFTVKAPAVAVKDVTIDNMIPNIGDTLTATLDPADATNPTYQWYRIYGTSEIEIPGATAATYQVTDKDVDYSIYVLVTAGGATVKSKATEYVTEQRVLKSAEIVLPNEHTVPQVNDVLELEVKDTLGRTVKVEDYLGYALEVQWYANGAKINGATDATYQVEAKQEGKVITAVVNAVKNSTMFAGEVSTAATEAVIKSTIPTGVKIKTSAADPFIGETISAVFDPNGASDNAATYQWYRGTEKIAGATSATYTVTAADEGKTLAVEVTLSTKDENGNDVTFKSDSTTAVEKALTGASVKVASSHTIDGKAAPTVFTTSDNAVATVSIKDENGAAVTPVGDFTYEWYIDSVADANKLYRTTYDADAATNPQRVAGENGTLDLDMDLYLARVTDSNDTVDLTGHTLIVVASTASGNVNGQGSVTSAATDAVKINLGSVTVTADTKNGANEVFIPTKTTLTATPAKINDVDPTVSYKWFTTTDSTVNKDANWTEISGQTTNAYLITKDDKTAGVTGYKVEVTGTGDYYGTVNVFKTTALTDAEASVTVSPQILKADTATAAVQAGDALTAGASVEAAKEYATFTWSYKATSTATAVETKGTTYTVPADAPTGATITLAIAFDVNDYVPGTEAVATVNNKISDAKMVSTGSKAKTTQDAGYDAVATPAVGETLSITGTVGNNPTVQWYSGDKKVTGDATTPSGAVTSYTIKASDLGNVISCNIKGGSGYEGSEVTLASGAVKAFAAIIVSDETTANLANTTAGKVGDTLTASVAAYNYVAGTQRVAADYDTALSAKMTYTWKVGGTTVASNVKNHPEQYLIQPEDEGKTISCEASNDNVSAAKDMSLTWNNGLLIGATTVEPEPVVADPEIIGQGWAATQAEAEEISGRTDVAAAWYFNVRNLDATATYTLKFSFTSDNPGVDGKKYTETVSGKEGFYFYDNQYNDSTLAGYPNNTYLLTTGDTVNLKLYSADGTLLDEATVTIGTVPDDDRNNN